MTFRSRPVLDRKHRPRWQDELRTQQLTVIGFAVAIAVALGIFGIAAWNGFWEAHLRPVASVAGEYYDAADLAVRERIITAETVVKATELQDQISGGPRDQILQQQITAFSQVLSSLSTTATSSLVDHAILASRAGDIGVTVTDADVDAAVTERLTLPERVWANLIVIDPLPADAEPDAEPTEEQVAAAMDEARAARERIEGGETFADVATEVSDDFSSSFGGNIGWFGADDALYGTYFDDLAGAAPGDLVGPLETDQGAVLLQLVERRAATTDDGLGDELRSQGVDEAAYRAYVARDILTDAYRRHFADEVVTSPAEQRRVAQIYIAPVVGAVVPQERARHILVQPDPDLDDQSEATDEQWAAALAEAQDLAEQLAEPDADWTELAKEYSDDPGSASRGGDLGWYDPSDAPFVEPFTVALAGLEVGQVSQPVRTDFGYHIIEKTAKRDSPQAQAADILERLKADPDSFADIARAESEDAATAAKGGELGWVAHWQLEAVLERAVFGLTEVGQVSEAIEGSSGGITIYKLLETSQSEPIEDDRLATIRRTGFSRWLDEVVRAGVETWIDPQFASSAANT